MSCCLNMILKGQTVRLLSCHGNVRLFNYHGYQRVLSYLSNHNVHVRKSNSGAHIYGAYHKIHCDSYRNTQGRKYRSIVSNVTRQGGSQCLGSLTSHTRPVCQLQHPLVRNMTTHTGEPSSEDNGAERKKNLYNRLALLLGNLYSIIP